MFRFIYKLLVNLGILKDPDLESRFATANKLLKRCHMCGKKGELNRTLFGDCYYARCTCCLMGPSKTSETITLAIHEWNGHWI